VKKTVSSFESADKRSPFGIATTFREIPHKGDDSTMLVWQCVAYFFLMRSLKKSRENMNLPKSCSAFKLRHVFSTGNSGIIEVRKLSSALIFF
jgi:hypothetical protein